MDCLSAQRLYGFIDGDLSAAERAEVQNHLAICGTCRAALEARRRIGEAASALPAFEVPADFAARIMDRIADAPAPERGRKTIFYWLAAATAGGFSLGAAFVLFAVLSGQSFSQAFVHLNGFAWGVMSGTAYYSIKGLKLLVLGGKVIVQVLGQATDTFRTLLSLVGPGIQTVTIVLTALVLAAGGLWLRRRYLAAEKIHEN